MPFGCLAGWLAQPSFHFCARSGHYYCPPHTGGPKAFRSHLIVRQISRRRTPGSCQRADEVQYNRAELKYLYLTTLGTVHRRPQTTIVMTGSFKVTPK